MLSELGELQRDPDTLRHKSLPIGSHADAIALKFNEPVEAKNIDRHSPLLDAFGEPGSDVIPDYTIIQAHVHMMCMNVAPQCHVPVCLAGRFVMFHVPFNTDLADVIAKESERFWTHHVLADVPPEDLPAADLIARVRRTSGVVATVDPALVERWARARNMRLAYERVESGHEAELLTAMRVNGEFADTADYGSPTHHLTFRSQKSAPSTDFAALKADKLFNKYCKQGTHRVLRDSRKKD